MVEDWVDTEYISLPRYIRNTPSNTEVSANTSWEQIGVPDQWKRIYQSVSQFSRSVLSDSLRSHELQHARPPCPSPTPRVYSNSCPSSWWCHPAISPSVVLFSSCPPPLPASGSFTMSQLLSWGGQSTGVSASASVLPMNTQDWSQRIYRPMQNLVGRN